MSNYNEKRDHIDDKLREKIARFETEIEKKKS